MPTPPSSRAHLRTLLTAARNQPHPRVQTRAQAAAAAGRVEAAAADTAGQAHTTLMTAGLSSDFQSPAMQRHTHTASRAQDTADAAATARHIAAAELLTELIETSIAAAH